MEVFRETHQYDPFFPLILMHRETWHYSPDRVFHFHDWYELVYVHRGEGVFIIDQTIYDMHEGEVFIVAGDVLHHTNPSRNMPYLVSVVLFDPKLIHHINVGEPYHFLQAFEQSRLTNYNRIQLTEEQRVPFKRLLDHMAQEFAEQKRGYRHRLLHDLHGLMIELNRVYNPPVESKPLHASSKSEQWLKEILVYIDEHLTEDLSLKKLAKQALVSPEHFSRVFKEVTGMNVPAYINLKRIMKARGMIMDKNKNIQYICDSCGFQSVSHFYRTFRKHFHMTPGEYLKKLSDRES